MHEHASGHSSGSHDTNGYTRHVAKSAEAPEKARTRTKARIVVQVDDEVIGEYALNKTLYTIGRFPGKEGNRPVLHILRYNLRRDKEEGFNIA